MVITSGLADLLCRQLANRIVQHESQITSFLMPKSARVVILWDYVERLITSMPPRSPRNEIKVLDRFQPSGSLTSNHSFGTHKPQINQSTSLLWHMRNSKTGCSRKPTSCPVCRPQLPFAVSFDRRRMTSHPT